MKQPLPSKKRSVAVLVIDSLKLRRASVVSLLKPWADTNGMGVAEADPSGALSPTNAHSLRIVVLVLGAQGVSDPESQRWIKSLCARYEGIPLVLMSDREESREAVAAFESGVRGFITTNMASPIAIQTLTFVMNGGSFFPPMALMQGLQRNRAHHIGTSKGAAVLAVQHNNELTIRQQEVLEHLQQGASNKLIGRQLKLRESTVKVHIRQIMRKLGATNRTQAALCAVQLGRREAGKDRAGEDTRGANVNENAIQAHPPHLRSPDETSAISSIGTSTHTSSFAIRAPRALRNAALRAPAR
jgi:DNA-binding NarL/FixJ family response regulator